MLTQVDSYYVPDAALSTLQNSSLLCSQQMCKMKLLPFVTDKKPKA